ncbi:hypothetical protein EVAR_67240_1 [Eumeta japonica]|uniref:Uncharacterized protein n=1 Tax=Eumeta variegata TaxID=151549 RepID=A0A4C1YQE7_EUMVA|nr:hypothetical protein EVAR_67240_1 [Eumeta japonica]
MIFEAVTKKKVVLDSCAFVDETTSLSSMYSGLFEKRTGIRATRGGHRRPRTLAIAENPPVCCWSLEWEQYTSWRRIDGREVRRLVVVFVDAKSRRYLIISRYNERTAGANRKPDVEGAMRKKPKEPPLLSPCVQTLDIHPLWSNKDIPARGTPFHCTCSLHTKTFWNGIRSGTTIEIQSDTEIGIMIGSVIRHAGGAADGSY